MRLYVVRHGSAGNYSQDPALERARPLTLAGRKAVEAVAAALKAVGEQPKVILASPYVRTQQTADILGKALGAPVDLEDELQPQRPLVRYLLDLVQDRQNRRVMLVGHTDNLTPMLTATGPNGVTAKPLIKGEVRRLLIDRDDGEWFQKWSVRPSDVGLPDES